MPQNVTFQVTVKGIVLLLVAAMMIWILVAFNQILLILFLAILLAVAIDPLVNAFERRRIPRALAILLQYIVILAVLSLAFGLLVPVMVTEFGNLGTNLPNYLAEVSTWPQRLIPFAPQFSSSLSGGDIGQQLGGEVGKFASGVGGFLVGFGKTLTTLLINTFLILVVGFFLTSDARFAPRLIARFFSPRYRPMASTLASEMGNRLGHWVRAQLLVGLFFGTSFFLGLKLLGVPNALSLGVAGGVLELIPYVGGTIVTVLAMLVALNVHPWLPLAVLGLYLVLANIESHVVYPKLVGDIVGLHPLTIIIALFVGAELKGVIGALLAIPLAVVLQVLFDHFYRFEEKAPATTTTVVDERTTTTRTTNVPRKA